MYPRWIRSRCPRIIGEANVLHAMAFQFHGRAMAARANGGKGAKWTEDCKIALPIARRFAKRPFNKRVLEPCWKNRLEEI